MVIIISEPATLNPQSRYSVFGFGTYMNKYGQGYLSPVIGAGIDFKEVSGYATVLRQPVLIKNHPKLVDWYFKYRDVLVNLEAKLIKAAGKGKNNGKGNECEFEHMYELERWARSSATNEVIIELYNQFPRDAVKNQEAFYTLSGVKGAINMSDITIGKKYSMWVEAAPDSQAKLAPILNNCGLWVAVCAINGFKPKYSGILWLYMNACFNNSAGDVAFQEILDFFAQRGNSLAECSEKTTMLQYLVSKYVMFNLWKQTRTRVNEKNWMYEAKYTIVMPGVSDKPLVELLAGFYRNWQECQVPCPTGDLPARQALHFLPITDGTVMSNEGEGLEAHKEDCLRLTQLIPVTGFSEPEYDLKEVMADITNKTEVAKSVDKAVPVVEDKIRFIEFSNLFAAEAEAHAIYNKATGKITTSTLDKSANVLIGTVLPQEATITKPADTNQEMERRHWALSFYQATQVGAFIVYSSARSHFLINQKSCFGPKYYFIDESDAIQGNDERMTAGTITEKNAQTKKEKTFSALINVYGLVKQEMGA